jgi:hypothetical protein
MLVADLIEKAKVEVKANQDVRDMRNCPNLTGGRQGDVYIIRADTDEDIKEIERMVRKNKNQMWEDFSFGNEFEKRETKQLADGTTKGSRHLAVGDLEILFSKNGHPCAGGIIVARADWDNTHPEHAHFKYSAGRFVFMFQLDARKESEVTRVKD